jgi:hypothetical protein
MTVYVYAIIDRPTIPVPDMPGLEGAALDTLPCQDIGAVVSLSTVGKAPPVEAILWQHETVVEALMADHSVLPVRFGTMLPDEAAVQAVLVTHYAEFTVGLERVRGHVELGLRVLWNDDSARPLTSDQPPPHSLGSGRAYMLARLEEECRLQVRRERAESLAREIHTPLARLAAEATLRTLMTPRLLLTAAYLVRHEQVAAFRQEVETLSPTYPEVRLLCTGPWPPFSFVAVRNEL